MCSLRIETPHMVTDGNEMVTKIGLSPAKRVHRKRQKALPFLTINGDDIAIFCHLKDVFCFADYRAKSDIFQRKNSKLQQILSVFKTLCPLTFAPPLPNSQEFSQV